MSNSLAPADHPRRRSPPPPPEPALTVSQRRLVNIHITASPNVINYEYLPDEAKKATDFTSMDPLAYRKNHTVRNSNAGTHDNAHDDNGDGKVGGGGIGAITMMTESQMSARLTAMGHEMRQEAERKRAADGATAATNTGDPGDVLCPKGFSTLGLSPPYDERSTYRADYCQKLPDGARHAAVRAHLAHYRGAWTDAEAADVDESLKAPYLTLPGSLCKDRPTVYRSAYMPAAEASEFRTLSHKTNLAELGTTFAYSAYPGGDEDPRRAIPFDSDVAALTGPRHFIYSRKGHTASNSGSGNAAGKKAESELQRMRDLRTESLRRSCVLRESRRAAATVKVGGATAATSSTVGGARGRYEAGTTAPDHDDDSGYIYLPQSHFSKWE